MILSLKAVSASVSVVIGWCTYLPFKLKYHFIHIHYYSESLADDITREESEFTSKKSEAEEKLQVLSKELEGLASETEKLTTAKKKLKRGM